MPLTPGLHSPGAGGRTRRLVPQQRQHMACDPLAQLPVLRVAIALQYVEDSEVVHQQDSLLTAARCQARLAKEVFIQTQDIWLDPLADQVAQLAGDQSGLVVDQHAAQGTVVAMEYDWDVDVVHVPNPR